MQLNKNSTAYYVYCADNGLSGISSSYTRQLNTDANADALRTILSYGFDMKREAASLSDLQAKIGEIGLTNGEAARGTQWAIWHISNGFDLSTITGTAETPFRAKKVALYLLGLLTGATVSVEVNTPVQTGLYTYSAKAVITVTGKNLDGTPIAAPTASATNGTAGAVVPVEGMPGKYTVDITDIAFPNDVSLTAAISQTRSLYTSIYKYTPTGTDGTQPLTGIEGEIVSSDRKSVV